MEDKNDSRNFDGINYEDDASNQLLKQSSTTFHGFEILIQDLITWVPKSKKKEEKLILKGLTTQFKKGTMTAIVGPSGSGKTTFLNYLSGRQD